uniref:Uncharacterized protein n=1 Tax=Rhizophagus irregularis (strain DAOM 181602 / DAOM 197198 / MUCL 43194) TaxID=747089 RepID=U9TGN8_RHIID
MDQFTPIPMIVPPPSIKVNFPQISSERLKEFRTVKARLKFSQSSVILHTCLPVSLNFRYRNAGNKNILFAIEISKDKKVSDLEEESQGFNLNLVKYFASLSGR